MWKFLGFPTSPQMCMLVSNTETPANNANNTSLIMSLKNYNALKKPPSFFIYSLKNKNKYLFNEKLMCPNIRRFQWCFLKNSSKS